MPAHASAGRPGPGRSHDPAAAAALPELVGPVDLPVGDPQRHQRSASSRHRGSLWLRAAGTWRVVGGRSDLGASSRERPTDRLDSELVTMSVDVIDDHFDGRSSSAAKKAEADFRIELARRSSLTSWRNALTSAASSVVTPTRSPRSISCCGPNHEATRPHNQAAQQPAGPNPASGQSQPGAAAQDEQPVPSHHRCNGGSSSSPKGPASA